MVVLTHFVGSIDIHISSWVSFFSFVCVCVFFLNSSGFVFSEPFSDVFCEVRSLKWPDTIKTFGLGL